MPAVGVNGAELYYEVRGNGPAVLTPRYRVVIATGLGAGFTRVRWLGA